MEAGKAFPALRRERDALTGNAATVARMSEAKSGASWKLARPFPHCAVSAMRSRLHAGYAGQCSNRSPDERSEIRGFVEAGKAFPALRRERDALTAPCGLLGAMQQP